MLDEKEITKTLGGNKKGMFLYILKLIINDTTVIKTEVLMGDTIVDKLKQINQITIIPTIPLIYKINISLNFYGTNGLVVFNIFMLICIFF
jgi:hypothetical protein